MADPTLKYCEAFANGTSDWLESSCYNSLQVSACLSANEALRVFILSYSSELVEMPAVLHRADTRHGVFNGVPASESIPPVHQPPTQSITVNLPDFYIKTPFNPIYNYARIYMHTPALKRIAPDQSSSSALPRALLCYDRMGTEPPAAPQQCQPDEVFTFCMQLTYTPPPPHPNDYHRKRSTDAHRDI